MAPRNSIQRAFDAFGKAQFQEKRSGWWLRGREGVAQELNLQKSQYSRRYYLNIRIAFDDAVPSHLAEHAHDSGVGNYIEARVEGLLGDPLGNELEQLLDIDDYPLAEEQREHRLLDLLERHVAPLLDELSSLAGILAAYERNALDGRALISRSARRVLDAL